VFPLAFTWPDALLFWAALAWAFAGELPFLRRERAVETAVTDRGSKRLILVTSGVGVWAAFFIGDALRDFAIASFRVPVYLTGVACIIAGGLLRRHCFRMLGERFTFDVRAVPGQHVVERGAYKYVRHPSYTAGLLLFGGIGLALGNWLSLAVAVVPAVFAYAYRIAVEERALLEALGPVYADYMTRTSRLIPFLV
jgi:protein-S-isoprenylcysteine O-methyltransferase Ste14